MALPKSVNPAGHLLYAQVDTERPTVSEEVTVGKMRPWDPEKKQGLGSHKSLPRGDEQSPWREHGRNTVEEGREQADMEK